jgi:hypothetical protein
MRLVPGLVVMAHLAVITSAPSQPAQAPHLDFNGDPLPAGAVARLGSLRYQPQALIPAHNDIQGSIAHLFENNTGGAVSPDGGFIATVQRDNEGYALFLMDTSTGKNLRKREAHAFAHHLQFTSDGKRLASTGMDSLTLLHMATGEISTIIKGIKPGPIALTSDGKRVAAQPEVFSEYDAPIYVWDATTGKQVVSLPGRGSACVALAFGPSGKRVLVWSVIPSFASENSRSVGPESRAALACIDVDTRKNVGETVIGSAQEAALCPDGETIAWEHQNHKSVHILHLPTQTERCVVSRYRRSAGNRRHR